MNERLSAAPLHLVTVSYPILHLASFWSPERDSLTKVNQRRIQSAATLQRPYAYLCPQIKRIARQRYGDIEARRDARSTPVGRWRLYLRRQLARGTGRVSQHAPSPIIRDDLTSHGADLRIDEHYTGSGGRPLCAPRKSLASARACRPFRTGCSHRLTSIRPSHRYWASVYQASKFADF